MIDWHDSWAYFAQIFWDPYSRGLPAVDVARSIFFTLVTFVGGWVASNVATRKKIKARLLDDLVSTQRELIYRAYPTNWKRDDPREEYMLRPLVERLQFIVFSLKDEHKFGDGDLRLVDAYIARTQAFAELWARAQHRTGMYDDAYETCYASLIAIIEIVAPRQITRVADLSRRAASLRSDYEAA